LRVEFIEQRLSDDLVTRIYVVEVDGELLIVDAGVERQGDLELLDRIVERLGGWRRVAGVFLTHGHIDHVGLAEAVRTRFGVPVYLHERDYWMVEDYGRYIDGMLGFIRMVVNWGFPRQYLVYESLQWSRRGRLVSEVETWSEEKTVIGGALALHTPGHTMGSSCLVVGDTVFAGDTVARGTPLTFDVESHIKSLRMLEGASSIYTAHQGLLPGSSIPRLIEAFKKKLKNIVAATGSSIGFYELFTRLYGDPSRLGSRNIFAARNLYTYIEFLVRKGVLEETIVSGKPLWRRVVSESEALRLVESL